MICSTRHLQSKGGNMFGCGIKGSLAKEVDT